MAKAAGQDGSQRTSTRPSDEARTGSFSWLAAHARRAGYQVTRDADGVIHVGRWARLHDCPTVADLALFLERAGVLRIAQARGLES